MNLSEGCPHEFIGGLSNDFYRRVVHMNLSEGCPTTFIGGLSNEFIGGLST